MAFHNDEIKDIFLEFESFFKFSTFSTDRFIQLLLRADQIIGREFYQKDEKLILIF